MTRRRRSCLGDSCSEWV